MRLVSSKPHVLHVIDQTNTGGAQVVVRYILSSLKDEFRFSVAVLGESGEFSCTYRKLDVPVIELGNGRSRWSPSSLGGLLRVVREQEVDLIHAHLYKSYILGAIAARHTGAKSILHDHTGIYPQSLKCQFPGAVLRRIYLFSYRYVLRQFDRALVLTPGDLKFYLRTYPFCREKAIVMSNAVDLDEFGPVTRQAVEKPLHRELGLPDGTRLVMMVARLDPQKDWFSFLETARLVQERLEQRCGFLVVGSGPEEQSLREYVAARKCEDVFFLNHRSDVPSLLHEADVFLLTSRREPFGIAVLEAMAAGCPVVATRSGGPEQILTHGVDGLLADVGDVRTLCEHVCRFLQDGALCNSLTERARETVAARYSLPQVSRRMRDIYREVLES